MSVYTIFFTIGFWIFCIVCVFWMNDIVAWHGRACNDVQCVCVFSHHVLVLGLCLAVLQPLFHLLKYEQLFDRVVTIPPWVLCMWDTSRECVPEFLALY
jgi:hypothetical protein